MPEPDPGDPRTTFGANLRKAREDAGLSQEALGIPAADLLAGL
jgi:hypothetical protein